MHMHCIHTHSIHMQRIHSIHTQYNSIYIIQNIIHTQCILTHILNTRMCIWYVYTGQHIHTQSMHTHCISHATHTHAQHNSIYINFSHAMYTHTVYTRTQGTNSKLFCTVGTYLRNNKKIILFKTSGINSIT